MDGSNPDSHRQTLRRTNQGKIIGHHPGMRAVIDTIERVAPTSCNVLVLGESGTGKELAVAALHESSPRALKPRVAVNCGAIPENLIESYLFGQLRGSYSGAVQREGYIAAAEGGTLFLDEIGELPLALQPKLLRVLQEREYEPVGAMHPVKCDIRVVAATNRDLDVEIREKRFREDLYFRLNVVSVSMPPLRERGNDVEALALYFLQHCAARVQRTGLTGYQPEAMDALSAWRWPGNVRELLNVVERAVIMTKGPLITLADLTNNVREHYAKPVASDLRESIEAPMPTWVKTPVNAGSQVDPAIDFPAGGVDFREAVIDYESRLLQAALIRAGGVRQQAATLLGLNRTTFVELIKRRGVG